MGLWRAQNAGPTWVASEGALVTLSWALGSPIVTWEVNALGSIESCAQLPHLSCVDCVLHPPASPWERAVWSWLDFTNFYWFSPTLVGFRLEGMVAGPAASSAWTSFARELGLNLRRARDARGITQEQLVERVGISLYAYQQYERGSSTRGGAATNPRLATVLAICEALDVSIDDLLPEAPTLTVPKPEARDAFTNP